MFNSFSIEHSLTGEAQPPIDIRKLKSIKKQSTMSIAPDQEGALLREVLTARGGSKPILDAVNDFYKFKIPEVLASTTIVTNDGKEVVFSNPFFTLPTVNDLRGQGKPRELFPFEARRSKLNYLSELRAKMSIRGEAEQIDVSLGKIPVMIGSFLCRTHNMTEEELYRVGEDPKGPKGYFITKGNEKILLNIDKLRVLAPYLYELKEGMVVRYTSQTLVDSTIVTVHSNRYDVQVSFTRIGLKNSINIFYVFYALGVTRNTIDSVYSIADSFIVDPDPERQERRRKEFRQYMTTTANTFLVRSGSIKGEVYAELATHFKEREIVNSSRRDILIQEAIQTELFKNIAFRPQMSQQEKSRALIGKIRLLAYMMVKYVDFRNGYRGVDDRDAWGNKQLVDPAKHMLSRFVQIWRQMVNVIESKVKDTGLRTLNEIRTAINKNYMTEQFINSFNKGIWGNARSSNSSGTTVVEILKRENLVAAHSHIRRMKSPTNRRAQIREKRLINNTQWGVVCPVMSPEGEMCLDVNTLITMANGETKKIGELKDGDEIVTVDPATNTKTTTRIYNHFIKSSKEYGKQVVKVTTINGREVVATEDHPFLTSEGWVQAKDLIPGVHRVAVCPQIKNPEQESEESSPKQLILARLTGWFLSHGTLDELGERKDSRFEHDIKQLGSDINDLVFEPETIPDWILNGTSLIKREFLAAFGRSLIPSSIQSELKELYDQFGVEISDREDHVLHYADTIGHGYGDLSAALSFTEYIRGKQGTGFTYSFTEWMEQIKTKQECIYIPVKSVTSEPDCMVSDFTTESTYHTMVSDGFVTHNCGLARDSAVTIFVSIGRDPSLIEAIVMQDIVQKPEGNKVNVFSLNGIILGYCNAVELKRKLVMLRRRQQIYFDTGIILDQTGELWVYTTEGRVCRPLLIVNPDSQQLIIDEIPGLRERATLNELLSAGAMEYIDVAEQEQIDILIAETVRNLTNNRDRLKNAEETYTRVMSDDQATEQERESAEEALKNIRGLKKYTHCEIDPTAIFGISAISIPFPEFNQGPRNTYQASMVRQALGANSSRIELRFDTTMRTIIEPGLPTIATDAEEWLGLEDYPQGQQLILAITTYGGMNQEDALILNKDAVDRGFFTMMIYHSFRTTICQTKNHQERIQIPKHPDSAAERYSKLDPETGIVRVGESVEPGDCIVGKVVIELETKKETNDSLYMEVGKRGVVDEVFITNNTDACKLILIRVREIRKIQTGDKVASRYAQKSIIGDIIPGRMFPWISSEKRELNGVRPHAIFNPHGIPSRMTVGKLFEMLTGKLASIKGERASATAFRRFDIRTVQNELSRMGFNRSGKEKMINGITGREMDVEIYIGPVYYQQLRHLVADKMQARATGSINFLTRQPNSGIRKHGGLRLGEMERDALIEHGAAYLTQERMSISSDLWQGIVCKKCNQFAISHVEQGTFRCRACKDDGEFTRIRVPYPFKLLVQLLSAVNAKIEMKTVEGE